MDAGLGKLFPQAAQGAVAGPEIVAPHADAVGFVHNEIGDPLRTQKFEEVRLREAFRRGIEQARPAGAQVCEHVSLFFGGLSAVQAMRRDSSLPEGVNLVLHQRDQRGHNDRQPLQGQRRRLVTQRLAPTRRQYHQRIPAFQNGLDGFVLKWAKTLESPVFLEYGMYALHRGLQGTRLAARIPNSPCFPR